MKVVPSSRRGKKWMAIFPGSGRVVHFGGEGCGDYIQYMRTDPALARKKRRAYIRRHGVRESWLDPRTPGTLSRYLLWEKPTMAEAIRAYRARFRV